MAKVSVAVSEDYAKWAQFYGRSMASHTRLVLECYGRSEAVRIAVEDAERSRMRKLGQDARLPPQAQP
jgi:hypothetical protein